MHIPAIRRLMIAALFCGASVQSFHAAAQETTATALHPAAARENFAVLQAANNGLVAATPILGGHEENQDFVRELVRVQWRERDPIDLYVIRPAKVAHPPVVLYLLSFPTDSDRFLNAELCRRLTHNGAAAVGFASALTGQRAGHRPMKQWFVSELQESLGASVHDVQMILDYLTTRGDVDMSRVGMFGQGSGASIAILSAAADPRIRAVDLLEPWGDWPEFLATSAIVPEEERANYLKPEFLQKVESMEPVRYLPALKGRALRVQLVDDAVPQHVTEAIEKATPEGAELHHYKSAQELRAAGSGHLFEWIGERLNAEPASTGGKQQAAAR